MKIYLASSWHNEKYLEVLSTLRAEGYEVYDFRDGGFMWNQVGSDLSQTTFYEMEAILQSDRVVAQFEKDMEALRDCDMLVLILPCGRSAHMELGAIAACDRPTIIMWAKSEPDIMHLMSDFMVNDIDSLLKVVRIIEEELNARIDGPKFTNPFISN